MADRVIFYTDDNVDGPAIRIARARGVALVTSHEVGLLGAPDPQHFDHAIEHGYVLVTVNTVDFRPLYEARLAQGKHHPGVLFIKPEHYKNSGLIADELTFWYEAGTVDDLKNRMVWI
jgi:hypothetical protein